MDAQCTYISYRGCTTLFLILVVALGISGCSSYGWPYHPVHSGRYANQSDSSQLSVAVLSPKNQYRKRKKEGVCHVCAHFVPFWFYSSETVQLGDKRVEVGLTLAMELKASKAFGNVGYGAITDQYDYYIEPIITLSRKTKSSVNPFIVPLAGFIIGMATGLPLGYRDYTVEVAFVVKRSLNGVPIARIVSKSSVSSAWGMVIFFVYESRLNHNDLMRRLHANALPRIVSSIRKDAARTLVATRNKKKVAYYYNFDPALHYLFIQNRSARVPRDRAVVAKEFLIRSVQIELRRRIEQQGSVATSARLIAKYHRDLTAQYKTKEREETARSLAIMAASLGAVASTASSLSSSLKGADFSKGARIARGIAFSANLAKKWSAFGIDLAETVREIRDAQIMRSLKVPPGQLYSVGRSALLHLGLRARRVPRWFVNDCSAELAKLSNTYHGGMKDAETLPTLLEKFDRIYGKLNLQAVELRRRHRAGIALRGGTGTTKHPASREPTTASVGVPDPSRPAGNGAPSKPGSSAPVASAVLSAKEIMVEMAAIADDIKRCMIRTKVSGGIRLRIQVAGRTGKIWFLQLVNRRSRKRRRLETCVATAARRCSFRRFQQEHQEIIFPFYYKPQRRRAKNSSARCKLKLKALRSLLMGGAITKSDYERLQLRVLKQHCGL